VPTSRTTTIAGVLAADAIRSVFQPVVDLDTGAVVAYEALARGPEGPLGSPVALFAAARAAGRLAELDEACRRSAMRCAVEQRLAPPLTVFVNVEPEALEGASSGPLPDIAVDAPAGLDIVLEITERALAARPAELLRTVERVRDLGWGVALDDVGADVASLAFMPLLRPDVVKLDLSLVQGRPSPAVAEIMNAVNAYAEHTGAVVLAEGIETEAHLVAARALGATLGQGWFFGRPAAEPAHDRPVQRLRLPGSRPAGGWVAESPFACLPPSTVLRRAPKRLLIELSKQLEREAMHVGNACVVASTFQHDHHFTVPTAQRYRDLVERVGLVCAFGEGLGDLAVPGLRGAELTADDPVIGEWDVVVLGPHFSAALLARDRMDVGPDMDRTFDYALTYERDTVVRAAHGLLSRVSPVPHPAPTPEVVTPVRAAVGGSSHRPGSDVLLDAALAATTNGVTVVDVMAADQPLVFVNAAFESLAGFPREDLLGRNCRFLQGPDTDRAAIARIREAISRGVECVELLLNFRGAEREPWWNEVHLSPILDAAGRATQYIGVQNDVTARVEAERALRQETDRARAYLARIEQLAYTDSLTGLLNRHRLEEQVEAELVRARDEGTALALLFLDLDGFKRVNDTLGHGAGDELLQQLAGRLRATMRRGDLLARLGGDEFLVAVTGLDPQTAEATAGGVAEALAASVARPTDVRGEVVGVTTSIGIGMFPWDAADFGGLMHVADLRMYSLKHPARA
jgi:diguanylate cyclase (GGDEF)-like protein/PAS domain S-box-containing protein